MDIQEAVGGEVQKRAGQYLAVGDHDSEIGCGLVKSFEEAGIAATIRLVNREAESSGQAFDGGRPGVKPASGGSVGLGDDADDVETGVVGKGIEAGTGQGSGAEESDAVWGDGHGAGGAMRDDLRGRDSAEQAPGWMGGASWFDWCLGLWWGGNRAFAEGSATGDAEVFVEFAGGEDEEEALPDWLGFTAFGAVKFAGSECAELLPHGWGW